MDHISIPVVDTARTRAFYRACLTPLGWTERGYREGVYVAFHRPGEPVLYFGAVAEVGAPVHLAFRAADPVSVEAFHAAGLGAGGSDNGGPGPRPDSGAAYYAAFVLDPDGHNVEAVLGGVR